MVILNSLSKIKLTSNSQLAIYSKLRKQIYYCNNPISVDQAVIYTTDNSLQVNIPLLDQNDVIHVLGCLSPIYATDNNVTLELNDLEVKEFISKYNFPININRYNCIRMGVIYFDEVMNEWVFNRNSLYKRISVITQMKGVLT